MASFVSLEKVNATGLQNKRLILLLNYNKKSYFIPHKFQSFQFIPLPFHLMFRRYNSTWSTMTSLWNRIRSNAANSIVKTEPLPPTSTSEKVNLNLATDKRQPILTPWTTISPQKKEPLTDFWIRTGLFRVSSQKLNLLGRQISRSPLPKATLQMKFSVKKAAKEVYALLMQAQARISKLDPLDGRQIVDPSKFIVQQAVVGKGPYLKRIDIKGRGRHGVIWRPHSFLRLQIAVPDEDTMLKKRFKVRIAKENKPVMTRLDY